MKPETNRAAGSLNRASQLIATIARGSRRGSALTELVARTGLPRPTIHRVLNSLIAMGWVERSSETGRYNLGSELAALGYCAISRHSIERQAAPILGALAVRLGRVVYLNVRSGLDTVCIARYESGQDSADERGWVGQRGPFGMSPSCLAMFAAMPTEEVERIIVANLSRYHRIDGFEERGFRLAVQHAQVQAYGTYDNILLDRRMSALAVAILDEDSQPIAAIGTTYPSGSLDAVAYQQRLQHLRQAAAEVSARLKSHA